MCVYWSKLGPGILAFLITGAVVMAWRTPCLAAASDLQGDLEHWAKVWRRGTPQEDKLADDAISAMGSDAAAQMARWINAAAPQLQEFQTRLAVSHFFSVLGPKARPAVPILINALKNVDFSDQVQKDRFVFIVERLGSIGPTAQPAIEPILLGMRKDEASFALPAAVQALAQIAAGGQPSAVRGIAAFLDDPDFLVRLTAAISLAKVTVPTEAVTAVITKAISEDAPSIPPTALFEIPNFEGDRTVYLPYLPPLASSPRRESRAFAARALGSEGEAAIPYIQRLAEDKRAAVTAVGLTVLWHYAQNIGPPPWNVTVWNTVEPHVDRALRERHPECLPAALNLALGFPTQVAASPQMVSSLEEIAANGFDPAITRKARQVLEKVTSPR